MKPYTKHKYPIKFQEEIRVFNIRHNPISKLRVKNAIRSGKKALRQSIKNYLKTYL